VSNWHRVLIEFKRIQTYLFAVPRLRTMLGANALLGELLRLDLPRLARKCGACLPQDFTPQFSPIPDDPLQMAADLDKWIGDDPVTAYQHGILSRDGGHFQALFPTEEEADKFHRQAEAHIRRQLPGLRYEIRIESWQPAAEDRTLTDAWKDPQQIKATRGKAAREAQDRQSSAQHSAALETFDPLDLPQTVCQLSGQGCADETITTADGTYQVSKTVYDQWLAGTRFRKGETHDIVGLLQHARARGEPLPCQGIYWKTPKDLHELAGGQGQYLALIHVDGNNVGKRKPEPDRQPSQPSEDERITLHRWLAAESQIEAFFYTMRAQVRTALCEALRQTFGTLSPDSLGHITPYQLLMVGGDDVLLAMRAEYAIPWLIHYTEALKVRSLSDDKPLDVGAGVAIAKPNFPFHALHALAEDLAASAKRLSRGHPGRSVMDWMIVTESSAATVAQQRRHHECLSYRVNGRRETLLFSQRPYFILPDPNAGKEGSDLKHLWQQAKELREQKDRAARTQRKALFRSLRQGRRAGQLAVADLPDELRDILINAKVLRKLDGNTTNFALIDPWFKMEEENAETTLYATRLLDLLELAEIPDLGTGKPSHD